MNETSNVVAMPSPELRAAAAAELRATVGHLKALTSVMAERLAFAKAVGVTFNGARDVYGVLGYDETVSYDQYYSRYKRGGIAGRVVDAKAIAVWRGDGAIVEDKNPDADTPFELAWEELNDRLHLWSTLQRAHILANIGSFSVLLLGASGTLESPLPKATKNGNLLYVTPFGGGVVDKQQRVVGPSMAQVMGSDATVDTYDEDIRSPRFGQPLTYRLKRLNFTNFELQKPVHWTRIVHIPSEGFLDDAIFGPPALENVWNYLDDLDKVVGGGSEAFWLRANAGMQVDIDKDMQLPPSPDELLELKQQVEEYKHQITRMMRTRGVNINQLGSEVADFKNPADVILTLIAGTRGIPKRILTGSEMGTLASEQDRDNWNDQVSDCRSNHAYPIVLRPFITRLIDYGYLPKPKQWEPVWPSVASMNPMQKLVAAQQAMGLNDHGQTVVMADEVRVDYLGKDKLTAEQKAEIEAQAKKDAEMQATSHPSPVGQLAAALRRVGILPQARS